MVVQEIHIHLNVKSLQGESVLQVTVPEKVVCQGRRPASEPPAVGPRASHKPVRACSAPVRTPSASVWGQHVIRLAGNSSFLCDCSDGGGTPGRLRGEDQGRQQHLPDGHPGPLGGNTRESHLHSAPPNCGEARQ